MKVEKFKIFTFFSLLLFALLLSGCLSAAGQGLQATPYPSETPTLPPPTETPTPTIVWFPPTPTFTPFPTQVVTPTLDVSPRAGEILLSDDFSDPDQWTLGKTASTSAALGKNELTLALKQPGAYLNSLRQGTDLSDFYLEITAVPSLCSGPDEYGLLIRVSDEQEFFRFSLTCDGQTRLDRYINGRASSPQPLTPSGAVPRGAPSMSRLAVWALGEEMRFYVNDEHQFTIKDPSLLSGTIGLFARSEGENAVTVSFSELIVREAVR